MIMSRIRTRHLSYSHMLFRTRTCHPILAFVIPYLIRDPKAHAVCSIFDALDSAVKPRNDDALFGCGMTMHCLVFLAFPGGLHDTNPLSLLIIGIKL